MRYSGRSAQASGTRVLKMAWQGLLCAAGLSLTASVMAMADSAQFNISAQPMPQALKTFAAQAHMQLLYQYSAVMNAKGNAVVGDLDKRAALEQLLRNSGLEVVYSSDSAATIRPKGPASSSVRSADQEPGQESNPPDRSSLRLAQVDQASAGPQVSTLTTEESKKRDQLEEVVVTGTHIRGQQETAAPATTISRNDIDQAGFISTQDVFAHLPQNFNELSAVAVNGSGTSRIASENTEGASAVSLHGLGPDATLTLLNGERRPGAVNGQIADVSIIPLSVIDHIDVVYGGNSAIYGADAVAGVVNIVTRQDYDGALSSAEYGAGEHGGDHLRLSQLFGMRNDWGGFLAAFDYSDQKPLNAVTAGYAISPSVAGYIPEYLPAANDQSIRSGYLSGHAQVGPIADVYVHALYSDSDTNLHNDVSVPGVFDFLQTFVTDTTTYTVDAGAHLKLGGSWQLALSGNFGRVNSAEPFCDVVIPGGSSCYGYSANDSKQVGYSAVADGSIPLPGEHALKTAIGVEHRAEQYFSNNVGTAVFQYNSRHVDSAFLEFNLPLVRNGPYAGLRGLDINLAGRYDDYSDFGHTTNPQAGLVWHLSEGLIVRGSYARSFRAPQLYEIGSEQVITIEPVPDRLAPSGVSPVFQVNGGNPALGPETANTYTFGVDFDPTVIPHTHLHLSYFNVSYSGRIDQLDQTAGLANPAAYATAINRNPSEAELRALYNQIIAIDPTAFFNSTGVPFDPQTQNFLTTFPGLVLFDGRFLNIAVQTVRGIDFKTDSSWDLTGNTVFTGLEGSYFLTFRRQIDPLLPSINLMNTPGQPAKFRARAQAGISRGSLSAIGYVNYVNAYTDNIAVPNVPISSWTTVDLVLRWNPTFGGAHGFPKNTDVSLSAQNLFNRAPPLFRSNDFGLGFDPTNANGLGRVISLRLTAKW